MCRDYDEELDDREPREVRLETNPIEDILWYWTLGKLGLKLVALILFGICAVIKILCRG